MKEVYEVSLLYDFYAPLLTQEQQRVLAWYYFDDWSLSEIAAAKEVSRAAAFDLIKRSEEKLRRFEAKLHLIERFRVREEVLDRLKADLDALKACVPTEDDDGCKTMLAALDRTEADVREIAKLVTD